MNDINHTNITKKIVYRGKFVNVRIDTIHKDDGVSEKEVIESKRGVVIAFVSDDQKVLLINQYRHNHGDILELPAGAQKQDETPLQSAKRELLEETGIKAKEWKLISTHHNGVHQEGENYFFIARGYLSKAILSLDQDEHIGKSKLYSFKEIASYMQKGKIPCLRSRSCIWLTKLILKGEWKVGK